jgi:hypothetical protein
MMFEGSKHVPGNAHIRFLEAAGASDFNGTTDFDRTNYFETLPSNQLELGLWLESDRMGYLPDNLDQASLANQQRFLILPWVRVPHLASHLLAVATRRLSADWQDRYGHPIWLVETFVERERFAGTAYQAAGWLCLGTTTGRTRQDRQRTLQRPIKSVWVKPLHPDFRKLLTA